MHSFCIVVTFFENKITLLILVDYYCYNLLVFIFAKNNRSTKSHIGFSWKNCWDIFTLVITFFLCDKKKLIFSVFWNFPKKSHQKFSNFFSMNSAVQNFWKFFSMNSIIKHFWIFLPLNSLKKNSKKKKMKKQFLFSLTSYHFSIYFHENSVTFISIVFFCAAYIYTSTTELFSFYFVLQSLKIFYNFCFWFATSKLSGINFHKAVN